MPSVLFVCLGNICRSPLAEGALRAAIENSDTAWTIDSAGTGRWHVADPPDPRSIAIAAANDVDISKQRARQIAPADFDKFDHIVAMDNSVLADLKAMQVEESRADVSLFFDHVEGREGEDVADPYYGGEDGFAITWADVTAGARSIVERLGVR